MTRPLRNAVPRSALVAGLAMCCVASLAVAQDEARDERTDPWITNPVDAATFETYREFFAYNARLSFDAAVGEPTTESGVTRQHVSYVSSAGVRVTAYLYRPASPAATIRGGIVYLHGGVAVGKETRSSTTYGRVLALDGWMVLSLDLLHYGERNTGLLTTFSTEEKTSQLYDEPATYLAFVTQTVKDVSRGYDYLVQERGVPAGNIVLIGHSRGAVLSSIAGAVDARFAGVVRHQTR